MPKPEKVERVKELTRRFRESEGAIFASLQGLSVKDTMELRRALREAGASITVSKNTLSRLAARESGHEGAVVLLEGPTAIAFLVGDAVAGAKAFLEAARRHQQVTVKGALIEGRVLGEDDARALATIEAKEVSFAKVAGMLQAPLSRMAYLLQAPLSRIAYALAQRAAQADAAEPAA
jgi:large subunit ribosomal protein L10